MKKIGIIGSGDVGKALASGFIKHGYQVMIGTRTSSKLDEWKKQFKENLFVGSFSETTAFGEIIVLATKGTIALNSLRIAETENLKGKTIVDTTNPIADATPENGVLKFFTTLDLSLMETLQSEFSDANFVKAFNSVGSAFMVNPDFGGIKPSMPICGNSSKAKQEVSEILELFGWETIEMGMVESARAIEPLCMLWCIPGLRENKWAHAFKLLRK
jgi:predicted dinucleotide-binding enzyme